MKTLKTKTPEQLQNDQHYFDLGRLHQKHADRNKVNFGHCILFLLLGGSLAICLRNAGLI